MKDKDDLERDDVDIPQEAANVWADVYIDVAKKLDAEEQRAKGKSLPATSDKKTESQLTDDDTSKLARPSIRRWPRLAYVLERPSPYQPRAYHQQMIRIEALKIATFVSTNDESDEPTSTPPRFLQTAAMYAHTSSRNPSSCNKGRRSLVLKTM